MKTQYNEVKREAAVGERIRIVNPVLAEGYGRGDEGIVKKTSGCSGVYAEINESDHGILHKEYVVLEPVTAPITADPLYENFRQFVRDNADGLRKVLAEIGGAEPPKVTQIAAKTLTRAEVIEKARKDVAALTRAVNVGRGIDCGVTGSNKYRNLDVETHINRNKRVVTVLLRGKYTGKVWAKGIAKCAPGDVFHAEIGKAIALRKALGLTIPTEYTDAPQPDEPRVGAIVIYRGRRAPLQTTLTKRTAHNDGGRYGNHAFLHTACGGWIADKQYEIIDDTGVDYSAVSAKEAA